MTTHLLQWLSNRLPRYGLQAQFPHGINICITCTYFPEVFVHVDCMFVQARSVQDLFVFLNKQNETPFF